MILDRYGKIKKIETLIMMIIANLSNGVSEEEKRKTDYYIKIFKERFMNNYVSLLFFFWKDIEEEGRKIVDTITVTERSGIFETKPREGTLIH